MSVPLKGIRVVELGTMIAVPAASHLLASYGAEVIKVEDSGVGDGLRFYGSSKNGMSAWFMGANDGKRSVGLNLKSDGGKDVLWKLIEQADVFIEGFRDGVVDRLGFGYAEVSKRKPDIVYCQSSGFGPDGPFGGQPVFDPLIQSMTGWGVIQANNGKPQLVRNMVADKSAANRNAQSILAALVARERTGRGCEIRNTMLEANLHWVWPDGMMHCTLQDDDANHLPNILASYRVFECSDGYVSIACGTDPQWQGFCAAFGASELAVDERFASPPARSSRMGEWYDEMEVFTRQHSVDEAIARLQANDVPVAPVLAPEDVAEHEQVRVNELVQNAEHPNAGRYRRPRPPTYAMGAPLTLTPAPMHGEHSRQVLEELGYSASDIDSLIANGDAKG